MWRRSRAGENVCLIATTYGAVIVLAFEHSTDGKAWRTLRQSLTNTQIGIGYAVVAVFMLVTLFLHRTRMSRNLALGCCLVWHAIIAGFFLRGNPVSVGVGDELAIVAAAVIALYKQVSRDPPRGRE